MRYILCILAIAGMVVSYLALRVHYNTGTSPCSINEKWDCGIVNHSPYAVMHGVPVAAMGIAGYLLIAGLALARRRGLLLIATLIGMGFALYLSNIEAHVLGVWCVYCVTSQALIAVLMILSMAWWGASLRTRTST
jgi:vitamin-K-epoxide reductase (warfarin-sensitive)